MTRELRVRVKKGESPNLSQAFSPLRPAVVRSRSETKEIPSRREFPAASMVCVVGGRSSCGRDTVARQLPWVPDASSLLSSSPLTRPMLWQPEHAPLAQVCRSLHPARVVVATERVVGRRLRSLGVCCYLESRKENLGWSEGIVQYHLHYMWIGGDK